MISVALACCDGAPWIGTQARSILEQLGGDDELVVSDAGSHDGTLATLTALQDPRLRILPGAHPRLDVPGNFARALAACRGDRIFLSDQDDLWLPGKVARCRDALDLADLVLHDARVVDGTEREIAPSLLGLHKARPGYLANLLRNGYSGCCMAFRRELLELALPFPERLPMHDWWLGLLAERRGQVAWLYEPLIEHRRHGANASPEARRSPYGAWTRLGFRIGLHRAVARRLRERPMHLCGPAPSAPEGR